MKNVIQATADSYDRAISAISHLDGVVSLLIRLILGPVLIAAGWEKLADENWFSQGVLPFPFSVLPTELSWFLASWTEFLGGICLLLGLAVRLWSIPLAIAMLVAAVSVHWDNGWPAIAPSNPPAICIPETQAAAAVGLFERSIKCLNVNARTIEAADRLTMAKSILDEHGRISYLNGSGAIAKLNSGIEFATIYFAMLLALLIIGGGKYLSLDYYIRLILHRTDNI